MNELEILARKYGTDKRTNDPGQNIYHGYTNFYYSYFKDKKYSCTNILEIGVREGWSHMMWYDFFPNATIYGIDNYIEIPSNKDSLENDRIKILVADQTDEEKIVAFLDNVSLDIIIDDGSHRSWHQQKSFKFLFPKLKNGGSYIIEDLAVCYLREFREFDDSKSSTLEWLELIKRKNPFSYYIDEEIMKGIIDEIESVETIGELGIIKKI